MAAKSKKANEVEEKKAEPAAVMRVSFFGPRHYEVEFDNWDKLTPGQIERSLLTQIKAWQTLRNTAVNERRKAERAAELKKSAEEEAQKEEAVHA